MKMDSLSAKTGMRRARGVSCGLMMQSRTALGRMFLISTLLTVPFAAATPRREPAEGQQKQSKVRGTAASFTGCVDERDGRYLLLNERNRDPIADLEAVGFPAESFAKHLGQKVKVRGTSSPGDSRPTIKVRSIETVSDVCAPQQ
jgi:hypothetical protein